MGGSTSFAAAAAAGSNGGFHRSGRGCQPGPGNPAPSSVGGGPAVAEAGAGEDSPSRGADGGGGGVGGGVNTGRGGGVWARAWAPRRRKGHLAMPSRLPGRAGGVRGRLLVCWGGDQTGKPLIHEGVRAGVRSAGAAGSAVSWRAVSRRRRACGQPLVRSAGAAAAPACRVGLYCGGDSGAGRAGSR
jgi:hypothetical protein